MFYHLHVFLNYIIVCVIEHMCGYVGLNVYICVYL